MDLDMSKWIFGWVHVYSTYVENYETTLDSNSCAATCLNNDILELLLLVALVPAAASHVLAYANADAGRGP